MIVHVHHYQGRNSVIQLSRSLIHKLRVVFRKTFGRVQSPIVFQTDANGLAIRCQQEGMAVAYRSNDGRGNEIITLPVQALADIEGKGQELVALESRGDKGQARWQDAGVPRVVEYEAAKTDKLPEFPQTPSRFTSQERIFLKSLDDAMQSASHDALRFALNKVQIRGGSGAIIGTDGHALLWQNGFQFPFTDDFLVPRTNVFDCKELQGPVTIAKSKTHLCIHVNPWTIFLPIDKESRFPRVESIIPSNIANATKVHITPENAAFLANALPRLPGDDDTFGPITLDLNGEAIVRARADGQDQATEVVLAGASVTGKPIRYAINREHLARALELGLMEGNVLSIETPMLFQDDRRKYVFQGLGKDRVVAPSTNDLRLHSNSNETTNHKPAQRRNDPMKSTRQTAPTNRQTAVTPPPATVPVESNGEFTDHMNGNGNGTSNGQHHAKGTFNALLEEAQSIQNGLRDLLLRTNQLLGGLKAYRRHAKTMQSTLASLRQLQQVEA
jgi:hypothetical protein